MSMHRTHKSLRKAYRPVWLSHLRVAPPLPTFWAENSSKKVPGYSTALLGTLQAQIFVILASRQMCFWYGRCRSRIFFSRAGRRLVARLLDWATKHLPGVARSGAIGDMGAVPVEAASCEGLKAEAMEWGNRWFCVCRDLNKTCYSICLRFQCGWRLITSVVGSPGDICCATPQHERLHFWNKRGRQIVRTCHP